MFPVRCYTSCLMSSRVPLLESLMIKEGIIEYSPCLFVPNPWEVWQNSRPKKNRKWAVLFSLCFLVPFFFLLGNGSRRLLHCPWPPRSPIRWVSLGVLQARRGNGSRWRHHSLAVLARGQFPSSRGPPRHHRTKMEGLENVLPQVRISPPPSAALLPPAICGEIQPTAVSGQHRVHSRARSVSGAHRVHSRAPQECALPERPQEAVLPEHPQECAMPKCPPVPAPRQRPPVPASRLCSPVPERPQECLLPEHPQECAMPKRPPVPAPRQHPPVPSPRLRPPVPDRPPGVCTARAPPSVHALPSAMVHRDPISAMAHGTCTALEASWALTPPPRWIVYGARMHLP